MSDGEGNALQPGYQRPDSADRGQGFIERGLNEIARTFTKVPLHEIQFISDQLRGIKKPRRWKGLLASAFVGIAVTSLFAGVAGLEHASSTTIPDAPLSLRTAYFVVAGLCAVISAVLYGADREGMTDPEAAAKRVLNSMEVLGLIEPTGDKSRLSWSQWIGKKRAELKGIDPNAPVYSKQDAEAIAQWRRFVAAIGQSTIGTSPPNKVAEPVSQHPSPPLTP